MGVLVMQTLAAILTLLAAMGPFAPQVVDIEWNSVSTPVQHTEPNSFSWIITADQSLSVSGSVGLSLYTFPPTGNHAPYPGAAGR
jgi:hypothetical protein